jgi:hypothetical protein
VYLWKGALQNSTKGLAVTGDDQENTPDGISRCQARLAREIVRGLGSLEAVKANPFFNTASVDAAYGLEFASAIFPGSGGEASQRPEPSSEDTSATPLRRAVFGFPLTPDSDILLDVEARIRPASGLAKMELIPQDRSFLQGQRVRLNYSTMRRASRLPRYQRGWPRLQELTVDPKDSTLQQSLWLIERFEAVQPKDENYEQVIDQIKTLLQAKRQLYHEPTGSLINVCVVDEDGQPCTSFGRKCVYRLSTKFGEDFNFFLADPRRLQALRNKVFVRATWLYASAPNQVTKHVKNVLLQNCYSGVWNWAVEAASRSFSELESYRFLFDAIALCARRKDISQPFPIQSARAICRVLMFREKGYLALNQETVELFLKRAVERLVREHQNQRYQRVFFQVVMLLLYLLRYRKADPDAFEPNKNDGISVFEKALECLRKAFEYFSNTGHGGDALRMRRIIEGFRRYLHYEEGEDVPTLVAPLAGDIR